jgi:hypothetical protein
MSFAQQENKPRLLDSQVNLGTTATTAFTLGIASSYYFILDVPAGVGTSPTLDVFLETSPDSGTTWYAFGKFTQVTTGAKKFGLPVRPEVISSAAPAIIDISEAAAGAAFTAAAPIIYGKCRINWTVAGTSPQFTGTAKLWVIESARGDRAIAT